MEGKLYVRMIPIQKKMVGEFFDKKQMFANLDKFTKLRDFDNGINFINEVLKNNECEPHEIYRMLTYYSGKNPTVSIVKEFINKRNMFIIDAIYNTNEWKKIINCIITKISTLYEEPHNDTFENILNTCVRNILIENINIVDIGFHKIEYVAKAKTVKLKKINLDPYDQQKIFKTLNNLCVKKVKI